MTPQPKHQQSAEEELRALIRSEIVNPSVRSQISTSDIAVGMLSSTAVNDRVGGIVRLIHAYTERKVLEAELEGHVHAEKAILLALTGFNKPPGGKPGSIPDYAIRQAAVHLEESEKKLNHLKESK